MHFQQSHLFHARKQQIWDTIQSPEFAKAMDEASGIESSLIGEEAVDGKSMTIIEVCFNDPLPEIAAKMLGTTQLRWRQEQLWDEENYQMHWRILIPNMERKISATGCYELLGTEDPQHCIRQISGDIVVRIPLIGNKVERQIVRRLELTYQKAAVFTANWIANSKSDL